MRPSPADWAGGQADHRDLRIGAIPVHMSINYILGYFSIGVIDQLKVNESIDIEMSLL
jgi:nitrate reductase gamma subunit